MTSLGRERKRLGLRGRGPSRVITDMGVLTPHPETCELTLSSLHPDVTLEQARETIGWDLAVSPDLTTTPAPTEAELTVLRALTSPRGSE